MAIARGQSAAKTLATNTAVPITFSPGMGNLVLVWIVYRSDTSQTITSVTDNAAGGSNTYVAALQDVNYSTHYTLALFYTWNCKSGVTTITVNVPTSNPVGIIAEDYSGVQSTSDPKDQASTQATGSGTTTQTSNNITTTTNDLLVGFVFKTFNGTLDFAATAPFSLLLNAGAGDGSVSMAASDDLNVPIGTYNAGFTNGTNTGWACYIASFKAAPSTGGFVSQSMDAQVWM